MRLLDKLRHLLQLLPRLLVAAIALIAWPGHGQQSGSLQEGKIYSDVQIITYEQRDPPEAFETVAAVGVSPLGKIVYAGTLEDVEEAMKAERFTYTYVVFEGATMVPGFFDAHSHFVQVAYLPTFADLLPPPDGKVTSIAEIKKSLIAHNALNATVHIKDAGGIDKRWKVVLGNGYDDSRLTDERHPTRKELDEVSDALGGPGNKDILICIFHQSGHYSVCNSAALNAAGYHDASPGVEATPDPVGGKIYREKDIMTGLLGEKAHITMLLTVVPKIGDQALIDGLKLYTSQGFTTVEDGRVSPDILPELAKLSNRFSVDVVAYPDLQMVKQAFELGHGLPSPAASRTYSGLRFRTGGVKLSLDGSPQGRSARLTKPYLLPPEDEKPGYSGAGNIPEKNLNDLLRWAHDNNLGQVLMHANGDASIDQLIRAERTVQRTIAENAAKTGAPPSPERRTVLLHGQFLRNDSIDPYSEDQIQALRDLKIFPSLFPMHTFYWGDWYMKIMGAKRAEFISPTKAVQDAEMMFSIHSDAPVTKPNSMRLLDSAVNRTTRDGVVLGAGQKISPIVALKAMTIWPAYQHFEEKTKGSIETGKSADFAVLSHNPLTVANRNLICIQIVATIKDGKQVYVNPDGVQTIRAKYDACVKEQDYRKPTS